MGWRFKWVSSCGGDFNADFHVSFTKEEMAHGKVNYNYTMQEFPSDEGPGLSVFYKDPITSEIFHTYSTYARGLDPLVGTYTILDLVPKGRDEDHLGFPMEWVPRSVGPTCSSMRRCLIGRPRRRGIPNLRVCGGGGATRETSWLLQGRGRLIIPGKFCADAARSVCLAAYIAL
jgi:hypothetical protein